MLTIAGRGEEALVTASGGEEAGAGVLPKQDKTSKQRWVGEARIWEAFPLTRTTTSVHSVRQLGVELDDRWGWVTESQCSLPWTPTLSNATCRDCLWATSRAEISRSDLERNSVDSMQMSFLRLAVVSFAVMSL